MSAALQGRAREPLLRVAGLSKTFGGLQALEAIDIAIWPGEVVGLVGDNGAGKSTLVRCIAGVTTPDEGEISVDGVAMGHHGPKRAAELGTEVVHQDLSLVMHGDVAQNLYLNREIRSQLPLLRQIGWLNKRAMRAGARTILDQVGMGGTVSVRQRIRDLSGGQRQCVAIGRAVGWSRKIVFLDEPTAALGVRQARHVLELIGRLRDRGIAVVLISHNMEQILEICDRVVVLRLGRKVADEPVARLDGPTLIGYVTGLLRTDA
ncbi:MAG: sugar ABC transporter ATP-binding protein [Acetobacteraceae bacterium]|nr:sugar ABC transporter ATP-binding protein [Acetobacteraceae bacterium]